jgi:hypothetical protein
VVTNSQKMEEAPGPVTANGYKSWLEKRFQNGSGAQRVLHLTSPEVVQQHVRPIVSPGDQKAIRCGQRTALFRSRKWPEGYQQVLPLESSYLIFTAHSSQVQMLARNRSHVVFSSTLTPLF